jgi:hypothetical protein
MSIPYQAAPNGSRYIPFTQQSYCCVPTSIQMIMYRNGIPLIPAEELGYHLGLTVPPDMAHLFYEVRTAGTPPATAGYGTQIFTPGYEPNEVFKKLGIPLSFSVTRAGELKTEDGLLRELRRVESDNTDALLCFNHGVVRGKFEPYTGHVVVFDRVIDGKARIVDASWKHPKWRLVEPALLLDAIKQHDETGGVWHFRRLP